MFKQGRFIWFPSLLLTCKEREADEMMRNLCRVLGLCFPLLLVLHSITEGRTLCSFEHKSVPERSYRTRSRRIIMKISLPLCIHLDTFNSFELPNPFN